MLITYLIGSGESVGLLEVVEEVIEHSAAIVAERTELSEAEKAEISENIGIAAIKYAELSQHRLTDYKFSWDKMLSLQGNTAPYMLYAFVRVRGIYRKVAEGASTVVDLAQGARLGFEQPGQLRGGAVEHVEGAHVGAGPLQPDQSVQYAAIPDGGDKPLALGR